MNPKRLLTLFGIGTTVLVLLAMTLTSILGEDRVNELLIRGGTALVVLAAIPATAFPICYALWFPFHRNDLGRALMTKAVGLLLLIDVAVLYQIFGDEYFLREYVRFITFALVTVGLYYQLVVIWRIKFEKRSRPRRKDDASLETASNDTHMGFRSDDTIR